MRAARSTTYNTVRVARKEDIRDLTANILREACNDIEIEAKLIQLTGEQLQYRSAITGNEARLDIQARSF